MKEGELDSFVYTHRPVQQTGFLLYNIAVHLYCYLDDICCSWTINNGNRTEWSPIQSVIIRVINKIGRPRSGSPIC